MEVATASGARVHVKGFAGREWHLPLLTMADLGELQREVPVSDGRAFADIFEIGEWSRTVEGSHAVLLRTLRKVDSSLTPESLASMGSIASRVRLASLLVAESLISGEEQVEGDDSKKKATSPGTG